MTPGEILAWGDTIVSSATGLVRLLRAEIAEVRALVLRHASEVAALQAQVATLQEQVAEQLRRLEERP